jgi:hypothetical protein
MDKIKDISVNDPEKLKPKFLASISEEFVKKVIFAGQDFPMIPERTRIL